MSSATFLEKGTLIWIKHDTDAFQCVEVVSQNPSGDTIVIRSTTAVDDEGSELLEHDCKEREISQSLFVSRVEGGLEVKEADLVGLTELNEPAILYHLRERYRENQIYTNVGEILISVNPYKQLPIYGLDRIPTYARRPVADEKKPDPHIFAVAAAAYRDMLGENENQSVLISGESGAGKTEATKFILQYLAAVSSGRSDDTSGNIQHRLIEANPILEAFGNAKTARNDNSSRFGKFIKVLFSKSGQMKGAQFISYLLEKTRICMQAPTERNYHIFYQICKGIDMKRRVEWMLGDPEEFYYANRGGSDACTIDNLDDAEEFEKLQRSMKVLGIEEDEQTAIFKLVAAILHLGNIRFVTKGSGSAVENRDELEITAQLLEVPTNDLADVLCNRTMGSAARSSVYTIPLKASEAAHCRDALAKVVYSATFDWLIARLNKEMCSEEDANTLHFIGVLDIFGFEMFEHNSFEQLCINYTNEKLQQLFNTHIFRLEQEEYLAEGVPWTTIEFNDNQRFIDLLEKRPFGLFCTLSEQCRFPKGSDKSFMDKMRQKHQKHPQFTPSRTQPELFKLSHYAGEVEYDINGMLHKNKNELHVDIIRMIKKSFDDFLVSLFSHIKTDKANARRAKTISQLFMVQLNNLMSTLSSTRPHFVRCLKPNSSKAPNLFEGYPVLRQLQCAGICECVRIRKEGFPIRFPFDVFVKRFHAIGFGKKTRGVSDDDPKALSWALLASLQQGDDAQDIGSLVHLGKSKIFLRNKEYEILNGLLEKRLGESVQVIQRYYRAHLDRMYFLELRWAAITLQSLIRGRVARKLFKKMQEEERKRREEEERRRREEEERKRKEEEERKRKEEEERRRKEEERRKKEEERRKKEEARRKKEEERKRRKEEKRRKKEEKELKERLEKAEEEERVRIQAEADEKARIRTEEEERARLQAEADEKARIRAEEEERARIQEEQEKLEMACKKKMVKEEDASNTRKEEELLSKLESASSPPTMVDEYEHESVPASAPPIDDESSDEKEKTKKIKRDKTPSSTTTTTTTSSTCTINSADSILKSNTSRKERKGSVIGTLRGRKKSEKGSVGRQGSSGRLSTLRKGFRRSKSTYNPPEMTDAQFYGTSADGVPGTFAARGDPGGRRNTAANVFNKLEGEGAGLKPVLMAPCVPSPDAPWFVSHSIEPSGKFNPKEGFTVYIDGARFLPPNASLSVIFGQMYTRSGKKWGKGMRCFSRPEFPINHPVYKYGQHFLEKDCDPTLTLVIKMLTLDTSDKQQKCVGYALLELFKDEATGVQPKSSKAKNIVLNDGAFQLPMWQARPGKPVTAIAFKELEPISCASVLVRVTQGEPSLETAEMTLYNDKVYDSTRCPEPSSADNAVAEKLLQNTNQTLLDILPKICDEPKVIAYGGSLVSKWAGYKLNNLQSSKSKTACSTYLPIQY